MTNSETTEKHGQRLSLLQKTEKEKQWQHQLLRVLCYYCKDEKEVMFNVEQGLCSLTYCGYHPRPDGARF